MSAETKRRIPPQWPIAEWPKARQQSQISSVDLPPRLRRSPLSWEPLPLWPRVSRSQVTAITSQTIDQPFTRQRLPDWSQLPWPTVSRSYSAAWNVAIVDQPFSHGRASDWATLPWPSVIRPWLAGAITPPPTVSDLPYVRYRLADWSLSAWPTIPRPWVAGQTTEVVVPPDHGGWPPTAHRFGFLPDEEGNHLEVIETVVLPPEVDGSSGWLPKGRAYEFSPNVPRRARAKIVSFLSKAQAARIPVYETDSRWFAERGGTLVRVQGGRSPAEFERIIIIGRSLGMQVIKRVGINSVVLYYADPVRDSIGGILAGGLIVGVGLYALNKRGR